MIYDGKERIKKYKNQTVRLGSCICLLFER